MFLKKNHLFEYVDYRATKKLNYILIPKSFIDIIYIRQVALLLFVYRFLSRKRLHD